MLSRLRFTSAGESHGKGVFCILEGIPSNLRVSADFVNKELERRQRGYGRGGRMKIEKDRVEFLAGIRFEKTLGSPIAMAVWNKDWENWKEKMNPEGDIHPSVVAFTRPRPGHADLAGGLKFNHRDLRNVLERASARETVARVAAGAICKILLSELGIYVGSYVTKVGNLSFDMPEGLLERHELAELSEFRFPNRAFDDEFIKLVEKARESGESLGGVFEVFAIGVPPGLGSYTQWDLRLDGQIAQALMSIQAIKAVEIGLGFELSERFGSQVQDEIAWSSQVGYFRLSNNLGGLEGGVTNGMPIVARCGMKPIPTL
ncbi:MAG: chorismate synthase, partial [Aquificaceae bacterium]|nr:chorismate synthase [Aquificaceae bacterium]MDW8237589.1 chorismate synthase [Aquificaceae bacterium]